MWKRHDQKGADKLFKAKYCKKILGGVSRSL